MTKRIFLFFVFLINNPSAAHNIPTEQKAKHLIHVWGLLKYHHPEVSTGKYNFDDEFIKEFEKIQSITDSDDLDKEFINWITFFDRKAKYKTNKDLLNSKKLFAENADYNWIDNSGFSQELVSMLTLLKNNSNIGKYYASLNKLNNYPEFKNERGFSDFNPDLLPHRMLFLSSFWNVMRYWNVNIYLADQNWEDVLTEMIHDFKKGGRNEFELSKEKLFTRFNDSHANNNAGYTLQKKLSNFPVYGSRIINDSMVITSIRNKSIADKDDIALGGVITSVNGKNLSNFITDKFKDVIAASNQGYIDKVIEEYLILADTSGYADVKVYKKAGVSSIKRIKLYKRSEYTLGEYEKLSQQVTCEWCRLDDNIGYINLKSIIQKDLKSAFQTLQDSKGIILDLRNYPKNIKAKDIPDYLYPEKKVFIKLLTPYLPSYAKYGSNAPLGFISNPYAAGHSNKNYYKGKIVLLVDRTTASKAEFIAMAIQQSPDCITIGEQTFGAVLNRKEFILADKTSIDFTCAGAFYPDDTSVQRTGIKLDYIVNESAKNYNPDYYIEQGIKIIKAKQ